MDKIGTFLRTIVHLKANQIFYQIWYRLRISFFRKPLSSGEYFEKISPFNSLPVNCEFSLKENEITLLNRKAKFVKSIDWNYPKEGKLWLYNLNYLDFINSNRINHKLVRKYLQSFENSYSKIKIGKDPYPTSIRIQNLIKLSSKSDKILLDQILLEDTNRLYSNLEYHIGANHLLENALALYNVAHVFNKNNKLIFKAITLLEKELDEQILEDGGHYERSYMYHNILLGKILEAISISERNRNKWNKSVTKLLIDKVEIMLGWSETISNNGRISPRFGDSIDNNYYDLEALQALALHLDIKTIAPRTLSDSGYRLLKEGNFLALINIGEVSPIYQPGHSHADTFSYEFYNNFKPFIVDPGISTYEKSEMREIERSTRYHNTVNIDGENNNEVWSSFRVGRKAKVNLIIDHKSEINAAHNGFKHLGIIHERRWEIRSNRFIITDTLIGSILKPAEFNIHFHPDIVIKNLNNLSVEASNGLKLSFQNIIQLSVEKYKFALGYNKTTDALKLRGSFRKNMKTIIEYK